MSIESSNTAVHRSALVRSMALLLLVLALRPPLLAGPVGTPDESTALSFGKKHIVHSKVLGRDQEIWIYTPPGYDDRASNPLVPVLYFPDAGSSYLYLAGLVDFLASDAARIPPMVLVGIANGQDAAARIQDLSPAFSAAHNGGGGAEQLYRFIHDEVTNAMERRRLQHLQYQEAGMTAARQPCTAALNAPLISPSAP